MERELTSKEDKFVQEYALSVLRIGEIYTQTCLNVILILIFKVVRYYSKNAFSIYNLLKPISALKSFAW